MQQHAFALGALLFVYNVMPKLLVSCSTQLLLALNDFCINNCTGCKLHWRCMYTQQRLTPTQQSVWLCVSATAMYSDDALLQLMLLLLLSFYAKDASTPR
jgi:hypothetical protein